MYFSYKNAFELPLTTCVDVGIIAYIILENSEDSEECVNDTWMSVWNAMPDKRPDRLGPFLARITRNFALTKIVRRTAKKRGGGEAILALEELNECLADRYDLEKEIEDRELSCIIDAFIGNLPEEEQIVLVSCYWYMASVKETSEKTDFSESKVKTMLSRKEQAALVP